MQIEKTCACCGKLFTAYALTRRFCSKSCACRMNVHGSQDPPPPTPQEIAQRCNQLHALWDEAKRNNRIVGAGVCDPASYNEGPLHDVEA